VKLPYRDQAFVPKRKLTGYLLSLSHPVGRSKARFFRRVGFDESNVGEFQDALLALAQESEVTKTESTAYGKKYVATGPLQTPDGKSVLVRTVWIVEQKHPEKLRFVTAYPA